MGFTVVEPVVPNVPTLAIVTEVAFVVVQLRAVDAPLEILLG